MKFFPHPRPSAGVKRICGYLCEKNYLFIGNAEAGPASALLYTLIANCREQKIDAERYFEEALRRMPINATPEQAAELTPAKLAPLIRELQPRPAYREKLNSAVETAAA